METIKKTRKDKKPFRRLKDSKNNEKTRNKRIILKNKIQYFKRMIKHNIDTENNYKLLQSILSKGYTKNLISLNKRSRILSKISLYLNNIKI